MLQFWSPKGALLGAFDSGLNGGEQPFRPSGDVRQESPFLGLTAGAYRLAGGFRTSGRWLGYQSHLLDFTVAQNQLSENQGLFALQGKLVT